MTTSTGRAVATARHLLLLVIGLACLLPIYWMYATSLRAPADVLDASLVPWPLSLDSYARVAAATNVAEMLLNTTIMASVVTVSQLLTALLASYALARWRFPGRTILYLAFVGSWLVPFQVSMLPNYLLLHQMGLLNSLAGVIVPNMCSALAVLMLKQHMDSFPKDLLDAAQMDGRGSWSTLWTVVVPSLRPALAALSIVLFINAWNEYFWPALVLQRTNGVLQLGLRSFMGTEGDQWGPLMALSGLACLPVLALYLLMQRQIISAFVRSGLK